MIRGLTFFLFLLLQSLSLPLYGQTMDALLDELAGSDADQKESELQDHKKDYTASLSSTDITGPPEEDAFAQEKNIITNGVTLQGLDKQTGRVFIIDAPLGKLIEFGTLKIVVKHCEKAPLDDRQESMAFVVISEEKPVGTLQNLFSGWMFATSPALSAMDHPTYDVWVKECKALSKI
ncbi:MAG: DUF2155 domain-containing protein [Alphaproteobacteria bacterium]|nr:DUF2155 domain-containing protein [Alphaproteobacteria bacterium]